MIDISNQFVIGDDNFESVMSPVIAGRRMGMGYVPRDFERQPFGSISAAPPINPDDMILIDMELWPELIAEQDAKKTSLHWLRKTANHGGPIDALDQGQFGDCWAFSVTQCIQLARAIANMPHIPLSGTSLAVGIQGMKEGGWCGLSLDGAAKRGVVPQSLWPQHNKAAKFNTAAAWEAAKDFRTGEAWVDISVPVYNRALSRQQLGSCLLAGLPCAGDYNWQGHSLCLVRLVDVYQNRKATDFSRYGIGNFNSWTNDYGDNGEAIYKDSKAWPDGAICLRTVWGG